MKLTRKEAEEARKRRLAYEHSMAIEGIHLTDEEKALLDQADRERMGYEEGIRFAEDWLRKKGVIPDHTANAAE
jgi:hypothetical protein